MELTKRSIGTVPVLELRGRFDAYETPVVASWLEDQIGAGHYNIVINMSGVNFIDSTALSGLVRGMKHCREKAGTLHLCNVQQPVQIIFELTNLNKAFSIFTSESEAVRF